MGGVGALFISLRYHTPSLDDLIMCCKFGIMSSSSYRTGGVRAKTKLARSMARAVNSGPWSEQVECWLSSLHPPESALSRTSILQALRLIKIPADGLRFFDWVSDKGGFSHREHSFFLMLELLGRARNLNMARNFLFSIEKRSNGRVKLDDRFFNSLIRSYGKAGLFHESVKLFETMKKMGVSPSLVTFNSLLSILLNRGKTGLALDLFHQMRRTYGVTPDSYTFNILISAFSKNSMLDQAFRIFQLMDPYNCTPDLVTYNSIVDGLCRAGKVKIARNVLNGMLKKSTDLHPNIVTYTTLLRGDCMKHQVDQALLLLHELLARGLKPNPVTYNTLIKGLSEARRYDEIKQILNLGDLTFSPDACTFNIFIKAHCDAGHLDAAMKVFQEMVSMNLHPDSASYSVLIRTLCLRNEFDRAETLLNDLFDKQVLLGKDGCKPLAAAYNPLFEYLCATGKTKQADKVFRQLMKRGAQDPPSYMTLITGHCREGRFKAAYELLVLMLRREFVPHLETYELLIDGLLKTGEPLLAHDTLQRMLRSSYLPVATTFHSVLAEVVKRKFANESFGCVRLMLEKRIRPNIDLSTHAVSLLFTSAHKEKAFMIVRLLHENGYLVKIEDLLDFLCENRKLVDAHRLVLFCLEKNQMVDIGTCDRVIQGLCKHKRHSEAFSLYKELVELGNHQQLSCHVVLRNALEAAGKSEQVHFVSKRMATPRKSDD